MKPIGMSSHQARGLEATDVWLTPPAIIDGIGLLDFDPCPAPPPRPFPTARRMLSDGEDGLLETWSGTVWLNPPYRGVERWLERLAIHGDGVALVFARTETRWFHRYVWEAADAVFFPRGRLRFLHPDGTPGTYTGGAPSVFIAYGRGCADRLRGFARDSRASEAFVVLRP